MQRVGDEGSRRVADEGSGWDCCFLRRAEI